MKKELADHLSATRQVETIMYDEGNSFMYDLAHLGEVLNRWAKYKETTTLSASEMAKILEAAEGGKTTVEGIEVHDEEYIQKNKKATPTEILDVGPKTEFLLGLTDGQITPIKQLDEEFEGLKKMAWVWVFKTLTKFMILR